jgi:hypothetical protein
MLLRMVVLNNADAGNGVWLDAMGWNGEAELCSETWAERRWALVSVMNLLPLLRYPPCRYCNVLCPNTHAKYLRSRDLELSAPSANHP